MLIIKMLSKILQSKTEDGILSEIKPMIVGGLLSIIYTFLCNKGIQII